MQRRYALSLCLLLVLMLAMVASVALAQEATDEPGIEVTDEPSPEMTTEPEMTDEPEVTDEPEATDEPEVTDEPEATDEPTASATPPPSGNCSGEEYTVTFGDTLFRIALRFDSTVSTLAQANGIANPNLILVGQILCILGEDQGSGGSDGDNGDDDEFTEYIVQRGDSLYIIAVRFGTTVTELLNLNEIANPNIIFVGQRLTVSGNAPTVTPTPDPGTGDDETPDGEDNEPEDMTMDDPGYATGLEIYFDDAQEDATLIQQASELGVGWIKVRVEWRNIEPTQGSIDLSNLDPVIGALDEAGFDIMLTVTNAPNWARSSTDENGPPDDLATFSTFVSTLASQYTGVVDAYEIWDEPNLRRNWNCDRRMCDTDYLEMLQGAADAIEAVDADALIITAGLAPTRFNDRVNAIDDRVYLDSILRNGADEIADGIGVHPAGFANPPDSTCCDQPAGVETHYEDPVFYFLDNLNTYREIAIEAGSADMPLWVTKFGWGTSEDTDPPGEINIYVTYTSLDQQAIYVPRAFEIGEELSYVGPMFLDNLNGCISTFPRPEVCYSSLLSSAGEARPVFGALQAALAEGSN